MGGIDVDILFGNENPLNKLNEATSEENKNKTFGLVRTNRINKCNQLDRHELK